MHMAMAPDDMAMPLAIAPAMPADAAPEPHNVVPESHNRYVLRENRGVPGLRFDDCEFKSRKVTVGVKKVPRTHAQAMKTEDAELWRGAEQAELEALKATGTFGKIGVDDERSLSTIKPLPCMWVYSLKGEEKDKNGNILHKARLVICGNYFIPVSAEGEYLTKADVAENYSLHTIISICAMRRAIPFKFDVKNAYLNGKELKELVFMRAPPGYPEIGVVKVVKPLYGLPQSALNWRNEIHETLIKIGLRKTDPDPGVFCTFFC